MTKVSEELEERLNAIPYSGPVRKMKNVGQDLVLDVISECGGRIPDVVAILHVRHGDFYRYMDTHIKVQTALAVERNRLIDLAEEKLESNVKKGDQRAIEFVLDRVGKHRGYGKELTIKDESSDQQITASLDLSSLSDEELLLLQKLQQKMITNSPDPNSDRRVNSHDEDSLPTITVT